MDTMTRWQLKENSLDTDDIFDAVQFKKFFVVLDAAGAPTVPGMMIAAGDGAQSLYDSDGDLRYAMVAPYLAVLTLNRWDEIYGTLWQDHWGVIIEYEGEFDVLRRHLRCFLVRPNENYRPSYWRFYDPCILSAYLRKADGVSLAQFFGQIDAFIVRDGWTDQFTRFTLEY